MQNIFKPDSTWYNAQPYHTKFIRVRTVHEKTDRTQYPSFRPQFWPTQGPIQNSLDYQAKHAVPENVV